MIGHGGSSVGGRTSLMIFPEQRMVVSVMSNVTGAEVPPIVMTLVELFAPARRQ